MDKEFIIKKNTNESVTFSVRIDKDLQERLDAIAARSNYSRNFLINKALRYALDNIKFEEE